MIISIIVVIVIIIIIIIVIIILSSLLSSSSSSLSSLSLLSLHLLVASKSLYFGVGFYQKAHGTKICYHYVSRMFIDFVTICILQKDVRHDKVRMHVCTYIFVNICTMYITVLASGVEYPREAHWSL